MKKETSPYKLPPLLSGFKSVAIAAELGMTRQYARSVQVGRRVPSDSYAAALARLTHSTEKKILRILAADRAVRDFGPSLGNLRLSDAPADPDTAAAAE